MSESLGMFKYYLFKKDGKMIEVPARILELDNLLQKKYPNLRIHGLNQENKILLFNALFESNIDLMDSVIDLLNQGKKRNYLIHEEFEYITLISTDRFAHNYGFLTYSDSKKNNKEDREKLIPIIYKNDLYDANSKNNNYDLRPQVNDLIYPKTAILNLIKYKNAYTKDPEFLRNLKELLRTILENKLKERLPYSDDAFIGKDFGFEEMCATLEDLLTNSIIQEEYQSNSSLWINILSIITYLDKLDRVYKKHGKNIDFINEITSLVSLKGNKKAYNKYDYAKELKERSQKLQNKISAHNLAFGTIFSENDILYGRKTRDNISLAEQERKEMDYLNKINENDGSYYTLEDLPLFEYLNDDQFRENGGISR